MATQPGTGSTGGTGFSLSPTDIDSGGAGLSLSPIQIADYDPRWPSLYEDEKARIVDAVGAWLVDIQHVGSTAVPGLAAKPIIDITVGVRTLAEGENCIAPLEAIGYEYCGDGGIPGRLYFHKPPGESFRGRRTHHLHMVEAASEFWHRHIFFRDYLREHPDAARQYADLKRQLVAKFSSDRVGYTEAKTDFIEAVLARATP